MKAVQFLVLTSVLLLLGCGGGGSSSSNDSPSGTWKGDLFNDGIICLDDGAQDRSNSGQTVGKGVSLIIEAAADNGGLYSISADGCTKSGIQFTGSTNTTLVSPLIVFSASDGANCKGKQLSLELSLDRNNLNVTEFLPATLAGHSLCWLSAIGTFGRE